MTCSTKTLRVLVVDDHELTRCTLQLALSMQSCIDTVEVAINGKEAIAKVHKHEPDVVVMDLHMPVMDGYTASKQLRQRGFTCVFCHRLPASRRRKKPISF